MKKLFVLLLVFTLAACSAVPNVKSPNDLLLAIKNYECEMKISYFSNKNKNEYTAIQTYASTGKYSMNFKDSESFSINYNNSELKVSIDSLGSSIYLTEYDDLNKNPLFLSYFIKAYFNTEDSKNIKLSQDSIELILPNNTPYIYSAKLIFKDDTPYSLSYFDKNGNVKVNIIYNEFTSIA